MNQGSLFEQSFGLTEENLQDLTGKNKAGMRRRYLEDIEPGLLKSVDKIIDENLRGSDHGLARRIYLYTKDDLGKGERLSQLVKMYAQDRVLKFRQDQKAQ